MQEIELWLFPLLLFGGSGLLILSTSVRYNRMHEEFHHIIKNPKEAEPTFVAHMLRRAILFKKALEALYVSAALFLTGALFASILLQIHHSSSWISIGINFIGMGCLFYAILRLIQESRLSIKVIRLHKAILEREMHWS